MSNERIKGFSRFSGLLQAARVGKAEHARAVKWENDMREATRNAGHTVRPWMCYRRDAIDYFGEGSEWPSTFLNKIGNRIDEAHVAGKKAIFADVAGEANGTSLGFDTTVAFATSADTPPSPTFKPVSGSLFVPSHRKKFLETVDEAGGELILVNLCMVGGGSVGGTDTLVTFTKSPDYMAYGLRQLEDLFEEVYQRLATGGYISVTALDLLGEHSATFQTWLTKKKIPFGQVGERWGMIIEKRASA